MLKMENSIAVSIALINMIQHNKINKNNALVMIKDIVKHLDLELPKTSERMKIDLIIDYVKEIAKGNDGILGTKDDLIPKHVIEDLEKMSSTSVFEDIIYMCKSLLKGEIDTNRGTFCCVKLI